MKSLKFIQQLNDSSNSQNNDSIFCNRKFKGRYLQVSNSVLVDPIIDPEFGSCFNCCEFDHAFQKCLHPKLLNFCHNCGRQGQRVDTCLGCYKAYQKNLFERNQNLIHDYSEDITCHEKPIDDEEIELQLDKSFICESNNSETKEEYFSCVEEEIMTS